MTKTQFIDLLHNIRKTRSSFLSIVFFVALALALYFALSWVGTCLKNACDSFCDEYRLYDLQVNIAFPLSQEEKERILRIEGIDEIEESRCCYGDFFVSDLSFKARVQQIGQSINLLRIMEGRLPHNEGEAAIDYAFASRNAIEIGDVIYPNRDGGASYVIVGLVVSPEYASKVEITLGYDPSSGLGLNSNIYLCPSAFQEGSLEAAYVYNIICSDLGDVNRISSEYDDGLDSRREALSELLAEIQSDRFPLLASGQSLYSVSTASSIPYFVTMHLLPDMVERASLSLASLFALIAASVCYVSVTRLSYSQSRLVGCQKALGFSTSQVSAYYLLYSLISSGAGCILGLMLVPLCQRAICLGFSKTYLFEDFVPVFNAAPALIAVAIIMLLMVLISYFASVRLMGRGAVSLLSGDCEAGSKHHFFEGSALWKKMSVFSKAIVKNFLKDKRRVLGTIVGIAGCTALLVCGFQFKFDVHASSKAQFQDIYHFNRIVYYDAASSAASQIEELLSSHGISYAQVALLKAKLNCPDGLSSSFCVYVGFNQDDINKMISVNVIDGKNGGASGLSSGTYAGFSYKNFFGDEAGYELNISTASGQELKMPVDGYFECYLTNVEAIMSAQDYFELFGQEAVANAFLCIMEDDDYALLEDELRGIEGFKCAEDYRKQAQDTFNSIVGIADVLALLYVFMAVLLCFFVVYNLLSQYVIEKKNELIVMRINGFSFKESCKYIYGDTALLTLVGVLAGAALGSWAGYATLKNFENGLTCFIKTPSLGACLLGIAVSAGMSLVMCFYVLHKAKGFKLSDLSR